MYIHISQLVNLLTSQYTEENIMYISNILIAAKICDR